MFLSLLWSSIAMLCLMPAANTSRNTDEAEPINSVIIKYGPENPEYYPYVVLDIMDYFYSDYFFKKSHTITDRTVIEELLTDLAAGTTSIELGPQHQLPDFFIELHSNGNKERVCLSRFDDHKISFEDLDKNYLLTNLQFYLKVVEIIYTHDTHWGDSFFECMIRIDAGEEPEIAKKLDDKYKQKLSELYKKLNGKEIEWKNRPSSDISIQESE